MNRLKTDVPYQASVDGSRANSFSGLSERELQDAPFD